MQAALCFSERDAFFAAETARYLDLQASLHCELAECRNPQDFLDLVEQCLAKEFVMVVLSAASVTALWPRPLWERVLLEAARKSETQIAYILLDTCPFPQVLRRRNFFDFTQDTPAARRALRRWAIQSLRPERIDAETDIPGEPSEAPMYLLDEPGTAMHVTPAGAAWMFKHCWRDFEGVYWLHCAQRSRAGVLGEMAQQMHLRLPGTLDQNWTELQKHAAGHRALYVFEHLPEELTYLSELGGKASVIVVAPEASPAGVPFEDLYALFFARDQFARDQKETASLRALDTFSASEAPPAGWPETYSIGLRALMLLKQRARLAEAHELLKWLTGGAMRAHDMAALAQIRWEEDWILDSWDLSSRERDDFRETSPSQLWLPL
jgi:hypothetical protein